MMRSSGVSLGLCLALLAISARAQQTVSAGARAVVNADSLPVYAAMSSGGDVKATLKAKLDVDVPSHIILGACRPPLAHAALQAEPSVGVLLPCNVAVWEEDDGTVIVSAVDPLQTLAASCCQSRYLMRFRSFRSTRHTHFCIRTCVCLRCASTVATSLQVAARRKCDW